MKEFNVSLEQLRRILGSIKSIENWRGDAYQFNDEVGVGVRDIKVLVSTIIHGKSVEVCPHCDTEQEIDKSYQDCPNCGKVLIGCSLCTTQNCGECPDGSDEQFDLDLEMI